MQPDQNYDDDAPEVIAARLREAFKEEAYELVSELESALLALENAPNDRDLVNRVFRALHTIKGSGGACGLTEITSLAHDVESLFDMLRKGRLSVTDEIIDLGLSAKDQLAALFDSVYKGREAEQAKTQAILRAIGDIVSETEGQDNCAAESGTAQADVLNHGTSAASKEQHACTHNDGRHEPEDISSIRVHTSKLDSLVDLVSELVTVQSGLSAAALSSGSSELLSIAEDVERLTWALREKTMSIRMVPIEVIFSRLGRVVRDLSHELGKDVRLETEGADTELDKTVIERLSDPLVHLVRNAVDHGIETPEAREAAGKPRRGRVMLKAVHTGPHVLITISDDGCGIDRETVRSKAVEKGLVDRSAELSHADINKLIFLPGFSTAENVTSVSGRGVGLDVVKKAIEGLRGSIDVTSTKGRGTTITLKLPLTLAIIEGLLAKINEEHFVFPLASVEECIELSHKDTFGQNGRRIVNVRGEIVPYIRLREFFGLSGKTPDPEQIVITKVNGSRVGFAIDAVIGSHQTVIKTLGKYYRNVEGISGATILGDGSIAFILDLPRLITAAERQEAVA